MREGKPSFPECVSMVPQGNDEVRVTDIWHLFRGPHLCERTFLCDSGDFHPNDDGYSRIGDRIFQIAGYRPSSRGKS